MLDYSESSLYDIDIYLLRDKYNQVIKITHKGFKI